MRLAGKVALITGAATGVTGKLMGFGGASAHLFAGEGARVVLTDIDEDSGERSAAQIRELGGEAMFLRHDVTREDDWVNAIATTVSEFGRLDVLVNNAGIGGGGQRLESTTVEQWDTTMAVHARGVFLGTKHAIPEMRRVGGGSIVNVSSIFGLVGSIWGGPGYHAAKGAIRLLTKAAAVQHAGDGIRVNSVHPGYALTPMTRRGFGDPMRAEKLLAQIPLGRFGNADEIALGILYLASDESSFVTGAELVIDGGTTAM